MVFFFKYLCNFLKNFIDGFCMLYLDFFAGFDLLLLLESLRLNYQNLEKKKKRTKTWDTWSLDYIFNFNYA